MTTVTILGRPGCGACIFTKRALELADIPHRVRNIDVDDTAAAIARRVSAELGTTQLPVVVCDDGRAWSGLQLHRVAELVREAAEARRAWEASGEELGRVDDYPWNRDRHQMVLERIGVAASGSV